MTKLTVATIAFWFFVAGLIALVGLGTYLLIVGEFEGMTALRGLVGLGICLYAIRSFRNTIKEQQEKRRKQSAAK